MLLFLPAVEAMAAKVGTPGWGSPAATVAVDFIYPSFRPFHPLKLSRLLLCLHSGQFFPFLASFCLLRRRII
jgi:hypothetical protein